MSGFMLDDCDTREYRGNTQDPLGSLSQFKYFPETRTSQRLGLELKNKQYKQTISFNLCGEFHEAKYTGHTIIQPPL